VKNDEDRTDVLELEEAARLLREGADLLQGAHDTQEKLDYFGIKNSLDTTAFCDLADAMRTQSTKLVTLVSHIRARRLALAQQVEENKVQIQVFKRTNGKLLS